MTLIEIKAYGSTSSKATDVIGDVDAIIEAKRRDAAFLLVTGGIAQKDRPSDLAKIVERQADGRILHIYPMQIRDQFLANLITPKAECDI